MTRSSYKHFEIDFSVDKQIYKIRSSLIHAPA
jgi:hypothetical protein